MKERPIAARFDRRLVGRVAALLAGLGLLAGVVAWYGVGDVARAFAAAGWGVAWVALFHYVPIACDTLGWRALFRPESRPTLPRLFVYRWVGESVNNLLPVAQVGGDVARARLAARDGGTLAESAAATVADFTLGLLTMIGVALVALGLLTRTTGLGGPARWILLGIVAFGGLVGGFLAAQAWGLFGRAGVKMTSLWRRVAGRSLGGFREGAGRFDAHLGEVYRRRGSLAACVAWRAAGWTVGGVEIWLATYFLGAPVGVADAFILHALTMAVRSVAFVVPAGLGVQEGGFAVVGDLLGMAGPTALALGLIRRVREILLGLPGLAAWWWVETRRRGGASHS